LSIAQISFACNSTKTSLLRVSKDTLKSFISDKIYLFVISIFSGIISQLPVSSAKEASVFQKTGEKAKKAQVKLKINFFIKFFI